MSPKNYKTAQVYLERIIEHVSKIKNLESLQVGGPGITDEGLTHLAGLDKLEVLSLWKCSVTGQGLTALEDLKELSVFNIRSYGRVSGSATSRLCERLPRLSKIGASTEKRFPEAIPPNQ